ncbi:MAG: GCN5-related N-acetyltransferase [Hyphomicrobiales bacterium]|nr:GCN5-related N-acetyltransferase [Hyphomicrobiales bacterium]
MSPAESPSHTLSPPALDLPSLGVRPLHPADLAQIEKLDERAFGPGRFARTAYRLREGVGPDFALSFVAHVGTLLVGANIMTPIKCGEVDMLLLGPLTVEPAFRSRGIGETLASRSLDAARAEGRKLVMLVGDEPYYSRLGFKRVQPGRLQMPGPVDPARVLVCELSPGAFDGVQGAVRKAT